MDNVPIAMCIGTAHIFRRLADEASGTSLGVLAKHLDLPMEDAETIDFLRAALRSAYSDIAQATHIERAKRAAAYPAEGNNP